MHARVAAATTAAFIGGTILILPTSHAQAGSLRRAPLVVSHRGASAYAPENTLASIDKAAAMGFGWVENDVQRTKDGELVVLHDASLARTTDVKKVYPHRAPWKVKDFTAAEVARLDAGSWFGPRYAGTRVPTLKQYMHRVSHNHQKLVLEIKNPELYPGIERQTLKVLSNEGWLDPDHLRNRLVVQSFSEHSVRTVHELRPGITTAFLGQPSVARLHEYARFADLINPDHASLSAGYVSAVHSFVGPHNRPMEVFTWTIDDANTARRLAGYGVDGVITNKPDVIRSALQQT
ncbi:glycerophosphodiester phosphodiesterase [Streptomyces sp. RLB3-17]|uniref:Glycerophosphodiester phosphodiesterase family protein n=1 Tax=Streptomyces mirabilis TaxID=68239 RepID=A0ABU3UW95_9ACTN|nr:MULTISPECIES: glycerophosphodiester phosphodiesterase family protein [Streptomyces]MCX4607957.1 glycerophosphodiester phosphodiesterase family protein [Streptomyces mirabilis]MCX5348422.1 glycerophosphodiester phosphodiesterase family protein [Streptomyces mirabilis]MDU8998177.1 glycerophosphodiester phosphodiesterase family protein [Streptomyces mirabilis]NMI57545.1 glycerophosphodiester phosphodiesterase [Streptomyces sp. RLA2-12]QDN56902.1 glycerophosphodiester phosphodiesterase [Strepto